MFLRKYGELLTTTKAITFSLFEVDGIDLRVDATFATGDVTISKDGGAEVNTTNLPVDEGKGYSIILTLAELTASQVRISIVDQTATKVWLDIELIVETYGNASAMHAFDLDTASTPQTADHTAAIADIPNNSEFEARTLLSAGYFDAATDTVVNVTTVATLTGHTAQTGDSFARIGVAGAGLTNIDLPNQSFDLTGNITGNLSGSVGSVTAAVTVGTMNANVINAASIAASAMDGKGDWNIGKTGYSLTITPPTAVENRQEMDTNSADLNSLISGQSTINTKLDDIQGATFSSVTDSLEAIRNRGDSAWLTATGFNTATPLDAAGTRAALGLATANMDVQFAASVTATGFNTVVPDAAGTAPTVTEILTTQMTESYAADGTAPTLTQSLFMIQQFQQEHASAGTTKTIKEIDGITTAMTFTYDDGTNPTSITRTT
jgi:hypothetical protein